MNGYDLLARLLGPLWLLWRGLRWYVSGRNTTDKPERRP